MLSDLFGHLARVHKYGKTDFRWRNLRRLARKYVVGKSILDAGCGTGHVTLELLDDGYDVTAIDSSPELVDFVQKMIEVANYKADLRVLDLINAEILGENRFDTTLCLDVLEHIADDRLAMRNLYYVSKKNGVLIVSVPALSFLHGIRDREIGHYRRYDKEQLINELSSAGFNVVDIRYWNFLGVLPVLFSEKILRKKVYEGMRYSRKFLARLLNSLLNGWFCYIENNVRFPIGISLVAICRKI